jgi:hypothetical protein
MHTYIFVCVNVCGVYIRTYVHTHIGGKAQRSNSAARRDVNVGVRRYGHREDRRRQVQGHF